MGILDLFRASEAVEVERREPVIHAEAANWLSLDDPRMVEFLRFGNMTSTGISVNVDRALKNPAMFRAVSLISYAIGMLPLQMFDAATKEKATAHPLYRILHRKPNGWQSAFDFKTLMQLRALSKGDAYALVLRSYDLGSRRQKISQLVPLDPDRMEVKQLDDWSVVYNYRPKSGGARTYKASEIFHLRGMSLDGLQGINMMKQAAEAIALALAADLAAGRMFRNGVLAGSALKHPGKMSDAAYARLQRSLAEKEGADNAGKNLILEEGMDFSQLARSARDAQLIDIRRMQVEEVARFTGVPRPLLMVDETSWGSGIYALGQFFVQYALNPWFEAWQQAAERVLLDDSEQEKYAIKFNAGALLRGSIAEQGAFFATALGAGGGKAFMAQNEVRDILDMPSSDTPGADELSQGTMAPLPVPPGKSNATKSGSTKPAVDDEEDDDE